MRVRPIQTNAEAAGEMKYLGSCDAIGAAALRMAEFLLWLFSSYLVFCFGLPRQTLELIEENKICRNAACTS